MSTDRVYRQPAVYGYAEEYARVLREELVRGSHAAALSTLVDDWEAGADFAMVHEMPIVRSLDPDAPEAVEPWWIRETVSKWAVHRFMIDQMFLADCVQEAPGCNWGASAGVCSGMWNLGTEQDPILVDENNVLDVIVEAGAVRLENDAWLRLDRKGWVVYPPWAVQLIETKDLALLPGDSDLVGPRPVGVAADSRLYGTDQVLVTVNGPAGANRVTFAPFGDNVGARFGVKVVDARIVPHGGKTRFVANVVWAYDFPNRDVLGFVCIAPKGKRGFTTKGTKVEETGKGIPS